MVSLRKLEGTRSSLPEKKSRSSKAVLIDSVADWLSVLKAGFALQALLH